MAKSESESHSIKKTGNFFVDPELSIKTLTLPDEQYNSQITSSIVFALTWLNDKVFSQPDMGYKLQQRLKQGIRFNEKTHSYLMRSCIYWMGRLGYQNSPENYLTHSDTLSSVVSDINSSIIQQSPDHRPECNRCNEVTTSGHDDTIAIDSISDYLEGSVILSNTKYNKSKSTEQNSLVHQSSSESIINNTTNHNLSEVEKQTAQQNVQPSSIVQQKITQEEGKTQNYGIYSHRILFRNAYPGNRTNISCYRQLFRPTTLISSTRYNHDSPVFNNDEWPPLSNKSSPANLMSYGKVQIMRRMDMPYRSSCNHDKPSRPSLRNSSNIKTQPITSCYETPAQYDSDQSQDPDGSDSVSNQTLQDNQSLYEADQHQIKKKHSSFDNATNEDTYNAFEIATSPKLVQTEPIFKTKIRPIIPVVLPSNKIYTINGKLK